MGSKGTSAQVSSSQTSTRTTASPATGTTAGTLSIRPTQQPATVSPTQLKSAPSGDPRTPTATRRLAIPPRTRRLCPWCKRTGRASSAALTQIPTDCQERLSGEHGRQMDTRGLCSRQTRQLWRRCWRIRRGGVHI